jgi:aminocarboxymuconate-semialdehyde decarboxylase
MRIVDFHNHFYPQAYIDALRDDPHGAVTVSTDPNGNPVLHSPGDANFAVPPHRDIAVRQQVLEREGIDTQVLTFTSPGVHVHPPEKATGYARLVNDALAAIVRERHPRFTALATLPLNDAEASVAELRRVMDTMGFRGAMLFGNVNGMPLSDHRLWPLYAAADERRAVCYIHPTHPLGVEAMSEYWLMPLVGFPFDTTLAAAALVFGGVAERFPRITWVLGHLGGAIPYLAERLDRGYRAFPSCRANISRPPSEYLRRFYYDTVNFDPRALRFAIDFAGVDRILAGSDFPHQIGSLRLMVESIEALGLAAGDRQKILGENAARLLRLDPAGPAG